MPGPSPPKTRKRQYKSLGQLKYNKKYGIYDLNSGTKYTTSDVRSNAGVPITGTQITVSEGHPFPPKRGSLQDVGGEFYTKKSYMASSMNWIPTHTPATFWSWRGEGWNFYDWFEYSGPVTAHVPTEETGSGPRLILPPSAETSKDALKALGTTAISRTAPTNSVANVATIIGELRKDGLPSITGSQTWKDRTITAKEAGSEYLNIQFGWRPLLNDVSKFGRAVRHLDRVLSQYERDAGKVVRRHLNFPTIETYQTDKLGPNYPFGIGNIGFDGSPGELVRTRKTSKRQWFSGAFTYYLPSGYDSRSKLSQYAQISDLLGLRLTPELLWELAPWSWAVDWFTNTGDVINNISQFAGSGLVLRYGYLMEESIVTDIYSLEGHSWKSGLAGRPNTLSRVKIPNSVYITHVKQRIRANPYGFGVTWDALSAFQLSILAALGISRDR